jgi:sortase (surface protein transpeptidase)
MIKFIFYGLVVYLIYKLVFEFVIPVGKASNQMREKLQEMQEQQRFQQEQARAQAQTQTKPEPVSSTKPPASSSKDYIEFEEIKP